MTKKEMDKLRSSVLYKNEVLYVRYTGGGDIYFSGKIIEAKPKFAKHSGLPYPQPKWIACDYEIEDEHGQMLLVARDRYGRLHCGFEWVINN